MEIIYKAIDGSMFSSEEDCKQYESANSLARLELGSYSQKELSDIIKQYRDDEIFYVKSVDRQVSRTLVETNVHIRIIRPI